MSSSNKCSNSTSCVGCVNSTSWDTSKMHTGFVECGYVVWFGQHTETAFLVSLFGCTQPIELQSGLRFRLLASNKVKVPNGYCNGESWTQKKKMLPSLSQQHTLVGRKQVEQRQKQNKTDSVIHAFSFFFSVSTIFFFVVSVTFTSLHVHPPWHPFAVSQIAFPQRSVVAVGIASFVLGSCTCNEYAQSQSQPQSHTSSRWKFP